MNLAQHLIEADRHNPRRILVIGDRMNDVYIHGRLEDTCQEGCPKFIEESRMLVPGGAANAARSLINWQTKVALFCTPCGFLRQRYMVGDKCVWRHDDNEIKCGLEAVRKEAIHALVQGKWHAVLLSDYNMGILTSVFIGVVAAICKDAGIPCIADCKQAPEVYQGCILKGNMNWLNQRGVVGYRADSVVITDGPRGPTVGIKGDVTHIPDGLPVSCTNHVGAGDCFAAHLTLALAYGFSLKDAAAIAHSAGRVYVQHQHNHPPTPSEVAGDMAQATV